MASVLDIGVDLTAVSTTYNLHIHAVILKEDILVTDGIRTCIRIVGYGILKEFPDTYNIYFMFVQPVAYLLGFTFFLFGIGHLFLLA